MSIMRCPMRAMLLVGILVHFIWVTDGMGGERIPYITIGIKVGWDSNRGFTMGPKMSFGTADLDHVSYVNLTLGAKSFEHTELTPKRFVYLDVQLGGALPGQSALTFGGGLGLLFGKDGGGLKVCPRTTAFFGFIAFPTLDFNFWSEEGSSAEPGLEIVLPVPLRKGDFNEF